MKTVSSGPWRGSCPAGETGIRNRPLRLYLPDGGAGHLYLPRGRPSQPTSSTAGTVGTTERPAGRKACDRRRGSVSGVREPCSRDFRTCIFGPNPAFASRFVAACGDFRREHYDDQRIEYRDLRHHAGGSGAMAEAARRWDSIAKPIGGLGLLEEAVIRAQSRDRDVSLDRKVLAVFCADNRCD